MTEEQRATEGRAELAARKKGWSVSARDRSRFVDFDGNYHDTLDAGQPDAWTRLCRDEGIEIEAEEPSSSRRI